MSDHEYTEQLICKNCGILEEYGSQQGYRNCPNLRAYVSTTTSKGEQPIRKEQTDE